MENSKRCKDCKRIIAPYNKSGYCSNCQNRPLWKGKFDALKQETDRRFKLYDIYIQDLLKKLRKYEPDIEEEIY